MRCPSCGAPLISAPEVGCEFLWDHAHADKPAPDDIFTFAGGGQERDVSEYDALVAQTQRVVPDSVIEVRHRRHMEKVRFLQEAPGVFDALARVVRELERFAAEKGVDLKDVIVRDSAISPEGIFLTELGVRRYRKVPVRRKALWGQKGK